MLKIGDRVFVLLWDAQGIVLSYDGYQYLIATDSAVQEVKMAWFSRYELETVQ